MLLSVVIPARNEEGCIGDTVAELLETLDRERIPCEIVVVDDNSEDATARVVEELGSRDKRVRLVRSRHGHGFGLTVRAGLEAAQGEFVAIMMADGSDDPRDLVRYYSVLASGLDCAFGSRFMPGASVEGYPLVKLVINRIVNAVIRVVFRHGYNDTTNAFKAYRREVVEEIQPLVSNHFNLTIEMPLKAVVRGYSYAIMPIRWRGRRIGKSKLDLREMGSRYLFSLLYVWLERLLTSGDYPRRRVGRRRGLRRQRSVRTRLRRYSRRTVDARVRGGGSEACVTG